MGPAEALAGVQRGLAMGAHRGLLVTDPGLRGADALVTARVLAAAMARIPFDLVIAGVESTDGYTGTMPATLAELLGIASVTAVRSARALRRRRLPGGTTDRVGLRRADARRCPPSITVTAGATDPRYPSLKGIMAAKPSRSTG